jgi:hypothetical protein
MAEKNEMRKENIQKAKEILSGGNVTTLFATAKDLEGGAKKIKTALEEKLKALAEQRKKQAEQVKEPEIKEEPAPRTVPTQTSLFGSAVSDIRQAISLGDRFLFQRELFAGNGELMQKTLDDLNALSSFDEAIEYIQENFEWDMECTAVQLFENVLKRRFN